MNYGEFKLLYEAADQDYINVRKLGTLILPAMDEFIDRHYTFLKNVLGDDAKIFFPDDQTLLRAQCMSRRSWHEFFEATPDEAYLNSRIRIGQIHAQLKVEPKHYLAAMHKALELWSHYAYTLHNDQYDIQRLVESMWRLGQIESALVVNVYSQHAAQLIAQLKDERDDLDWLYQKAPIGFAVFDINGMLVRINEYISVIYNLNSDGYVGRNIHDALPLIASRFDHAKNAILMTKKPYLVQENISVRSSNSENERHFNENWHPITNKNNVIIGLGLIVEETTDKRNAAILREQENIKNQFLSTLSHELRNPVSTISTSIEMVQEIANDSTPAYQKISPYIDRANRQLRHLIRLLDDLLEISRITHGKIQLNLAVVDVNEIIRGAIDLSLENVEKHNHELIVRWPDTKIFVYGDRERLTQIFSNLIDNAAKYTNAYGNISILITEKNHEVIIEVTDNGVGIKQECLSNIFQIFHQIRSSGEKHGRGLGIGLALVRQLTHLHHGVIEAASEGEGKGSTFTVKLPLIHP